MYITIRKRHVYHKLISLVTASFFFLNVFTADVLALAPELRSKPFSKAIKVEIEMVAKMMDAASQIKRLIEADNDRKNPIMRLSQDCFPDGEIEIESKLKDGALTTGREYKCAVFHFKKTNKTIEARFFKDANLNEVELLELGVKRDDDKLHFFNSPEYPALRGVWFVDPDGAPQGSDLEASQSANTEKPSSKIAGAMVQNESDAIAATGSVSRDGVAMREPSLSSQEVPINLEQIDLMAGGSNATGIYHDRPVGQKSILKDEDIGRISLVVNLSEKCFGETDIRDCAEASMMLFRILAMVGIEARVAGFDDHYVVILKNGCVVDAFVRGSEINVKFPFVDAIISEPGSSTWSYYSNFVALTHEDLKEFGRQKRYIDKLFVQNEDLVSNGLKNAHRVEAPGTLSESAQKVSPAPAEGTPLGSDLKTSRSANQSQAAFAGDKVFLNRTSVDATRAGAPTTPASDRVGPDGMAPNEPSPNMPNMLASDSILRLQDAVSVEKYAALLADAISSKDLSAETAMLGMAKTVISKNPEDVPSLVECMRKMLDFETGSESSAYVNMAVFKMLSLVPDDYKTVALARSAARIIYYKGESKDDLRAAARGFFASYPRAAMFHKSESEAMEEFNEMSKGVRLDNPISQYIRDMEAHPLLTVTGEVVLSSLAHLGDDKAAKEMAASNLRYVISVVKKYIRHNMPLYDLISPGNDGLLKAVEKFDPTRGFKFSTYAEDWIKRSARRYIQNNYRQIRIPIDRQTEMKQFKRECAALEIDPYDYNISDSEIADSLCMKESKVRLMREMMAGITSLSKPYKEGDADEGPESTIEGSTGARDMAFEKSDRNEMVGAIAREVESRIAKSSKTPERDIDIFRKRVLPLFMMEIPQTLEEVGSACGVAKERIRQIEAKIISRHVYWALRELKLTQNDFLGEYEPPAGSIYSVFKYVLSSSSKERPLNIDDISARHGAYDTIKYDLRALYYHLHLIERESGTGRTARYYVPESVRKKLEDQDIREKLFKVLEVFRGNSLRPNPTDLRNIYEGKIRIILAQNVKADTDNGAIPEGDTLQVDTPETLSSIGTPTGSGLKTSLRDTQRLYNVWNKIYTEGRKLIINIVHHSGYAAKADVWGTNDGQKLLISEKLLELPDDEIAFILAHEAAHLMGIDSSEPGFLNGFIFYSRQKELKAHEEGFKIAVSAGFDPRAALKIVKKSLKRDTKLRWFVGFIKDLIGIEPSYRRVRLLYERLIEENVFLDGLSGKRGTLSESSLEVSSADAEGTPLGSDLEASQSANTEKPSSKIAGAMVQNESDAIADTGSGTVDGESEAVPEPNIYANEFLKDRIVVLRNNVPGKNKGQVALRVREQYELDVGEIQQVADSLGQWLKCDSLTSPHSSVIAKYIDDLEQTKRFIKQFPGMKDSTGGLYFVLSDPEINGSGKLEVEGIVETFGPRVTCWEINPLNRDAAVERSRRGLEVEKSADGKRKFKGVGRQLLRYVINRELQRGRRGLVFALPNAESELKAEGLKSEVLYEASKLEQYLYDKSDETLSIIDEEVEEKSDSHFLGQAFRAALGMSDKGKEGAVGENKGAVKADLSSEARRAKEDLPAEARRAKEDLPAEVRRAKEDLPAEASSGPIAAAKAEADLIHTENMKREHMPAIADKEILCHIVTDTILPADQRNMLKVSIEQAMDGKNKHIERIAALSGENVGNPDKYIEDLRSLMKKKQDLYASLGYTKVRFTLACPDVRFDDKTTLIDKVLESGIDIKALAFEPCDTSRFNLVQVEGIMLALRVLDSGDLAKLKSIYAFLAKHALSPEYANIADINIFIRKVAFILPAAKVEDYELKRTLHYLAHNIWQAA